MSLCKIAPLLLTASLLFAKDAREERLDLFVKDLRAMIERVQKSTKEPNPENTVRDLPNAALGIVALGGDPREAERLVRLAFTQQDMNADSPAFGTVLWKIGHTEIKDANAIEFACQAIGPLFIRYGGKLSPAFKKDMEPHMRAAIAAIRRHKVPVTYTNIFLMKAVNLILLNEALRDMDGAADGYGQIDEWIAYTRQNGVREFQSPTYYSVDLNDLTNGYLFAARPDAREKFRKALDYFWADIAANYFAPRGTLSGPHSRDYDFLTGHGGLEFQLFQEGLRTRPALQGADLEKVHFVVNEIAGGYRPPEKLMKPAAERVIQSRWEPGPDRYHYITPDFAIGSSTSNYGPQDKLIAVELASDETWPAISVVPDLTDQPYGKLKKTDRSGHNKPVHLPLYPLAVQEKGSMLALLDLNPSREEGVTSLATNVILPANAELSLDGQRIASGKEFEKAVKLNSVIGVRHGNAAVAIRMFRVDGAGGQDPKLFLKADKPGLKYGAARLAAYHYAGDATKLANDHVRVGIVMVAETGGDVQALVERVRKADIKDELTANEWKASARIGALTLEAARDPKARATLYRRVNGAEPQIQVLNVNGEDMTKLLK
jgi:hypothetical protein